MDTQETFEEIFKRMQETMVHARDKEQMQEYMQNYKTLCRDLLDISKNEALRKKKDELEKRYSRSIRMELYERIKSIMDTHTKRNKAGEDYLMFKHLTLVNEVVKDIHTRIQFKNNASETTQTGPLKYPSLAKRFRFSDHNLPYSWVQVDWLLHQLETENRVTPDMVLTQIVITQQFPHKCMTSPIRTLPMDLIKCLTTFLYAPRRKGLFE